MSAGLLSSAVMVRGTGARQAAVWQPCPGRPQEENRECSAPHLSKLHVDSLTGHPEAQDPTIYMGFCGVSLPYMVYKVLHSSTILPLGATEQSRMIQSKLCVFSAIPRFLHHSVVPHPQIHSRFPCFSSPSSRFRDQRNNYLWALLGEGKKKR